MMRVTGGIQFHSTVSPYHGTSLRGLRRASTARRYSNPTQSRTTWLRTALPFKFGNKFGKNGKNLLPIQSRTTVSRSPTTHAAMTHEVSRVTVAYGAYRQPSVERKETFD